MKLYYGRDVRGIYKASLNYDTIRRYSFDGNISSGDVPVIHNGKVYLIKTLYGTDPITNEMVEATSGPYYSVSSAEKSESWNQLKEIVRLYAGIDGGDAEIAMDATSITAGSVLDQSLYDNCINSKIIGIQII